MLTQDDDGIVLFFLSDISSNSFYQVNTESWELKVAETWHLI